ncbi:hypothetical protein B2_2 [Stenotrophomonas phage B2]|nr:hypothetical protein B2_2 [Stenotrophomonas phage B2]
MNQTPKSWSDILRDRSLDDFLFNRELFLAAEEYAHQAQQPVNTWLAKTEFVQDLMNSHGLDAKYLGWHRADVLRDLIEAQAQPSVSHQLTGDEARRIASSVGTSASDSPSPVEYVAAGYRAALAQQNSVPPEEKEDDGKCRSCDEDSCTAGRECVALSHPVPDLFDQLLGKLGFSLAGDEQIGRLNVCIKTDRGTATYLYSKDDLIAAIEGRFNPEERKS